MNKFLVIGAFAKAEQQLKSKGVHSPSLTKMATELSDFIEEQEGLILGERSLRDYRGEAAKLKNEEQDINIKQLAVVNGLCKYLGYDNYEGFYNSQNVLAEEIILEPKERKQQLHLSIKIVIILSLIVTIVSLIYSFSNRQRWMIWQNDQYIEVDFDAKKYDLHQLKLYKDYRVSSFKKVMVTCNTIFFNEDESVRIWYGKNKMKELEYFTDVGLHPETGKTLKPITKYMIMKHICTDGD